MGDYVKATINGATPTYAVPATVEGSIDYRGSASMEAHLLSRDNPHNVTKAQIGLDEVLNKEQLGVNDTAYDSARLGSVLAADFWNKYNSNLPTIDWSAKTITASGDIIAKRPDSLIFTASDLTTGYEYLYQLLDVTIKDPIKGQSLVFDNISNTWVNKSLTAGDVGALPSNWRPSWGDVTGKPDTFTPSAHTQAISTITGLQDALNGKQPSGNYEAAFTKNTAFNKNFGSSAGTVCEGNDSRLSDSRPASDVYAWAKAETKPSYDKGEVGLSNVDNTSDADKPISTATQSALNLKANKNGDSTEDL